MPDRSILTPLELEILQAALLLEARGTAEFHGYDLAANLEDQDGAYRRTGFSTLYRALDRLDRRKLLASRWNLSGPRPRRLYHVNGQEARQAIATSTRTAARPTPRLVIG